MIQIFFFKLNFPSIAFLVGDYDLFHELISLGASIKILVTVLCNSFNVQALTYLNQYEYLNGWNAIDLLKQTLVSHFGFYETLDFDGKQKDNVVNFIFSDRVRKKLYWNQQGNWSELLFSVIDKSDVDITLRILKYMSTSPYPELSTYPNANNEVSKLFHSNFKTGIDEQYLTENECNTNHLIVNRVLSLRKKEFTIWYPNEQLVQILMILQEKYGLNLNIDYKEKNLNIHWPYA